MSDQKYRQRGYKDDERPSRSSTSSAGRPAAKDGPKSRGLGRPGKAEFRCGSCNAAQPLSEEVGAEARCSSCDAPLHTCRNCRHFDSSSPNECREAVEERVARKSESNRCPLFAPKQVQTIGAATDPSDPTDAKSAFDDLFDF